jgi:beta-N-acetylhexosaminidase
MLASVLVGTALSACSSSPVPPAGSVSVPPAASSASSASSGSSAGPTAAPASPSPADPDGLTPAQRDQVTAALAGLDRRGQVAQLFVVGVPLTDLSTGDQLAAQGVGGIFLRGRSTAAAGDLAATAARWARLGGVRPWVSADQEGGRVQALSGPGFRPLPSAREQGQLPPAELAALADGVGADLAGAGVTLDLAPVADVVPAGTEAANAPIGYHDRQYGSTAAAVVAAADTVVDGLGRHGVTAALKHFPGLGRVGQDTDDSAGVTDTVTPSDGDQVAAFGALVRSPKHPFIMVSSATYTLIDASAPALFSPVVITDLLRSRLGFRGVVLTDDVGQTTALQAVPPADRAVRFLAAGGTLILTVRAGLLPEMIDAVLARSAADPAFGTTVDAAVRTALVAKARAGLLAPA